MIILVTKTDLDKYKYVADSVRNSAIWPQFVQEAQLLDIKSWLGDQLLNELFTQFNTSPQSFTQLNQLLLDGGAYVYDKKTYLFQGLKACIIYYAFARFSSKMGYNYTAMGIVTKDSDLSTPASDKAIQRLATENMLIGDALRDEILIYLKRNYKDYPLFSSCGGERKNRTFQTIGD
jgi:hypothetical protein